MKHQTHIFVSEGELFSCLARQESGVKMQTRVKFTWTFCSLCTAYVQ